MSKAVEFRHDDAGYLHWRREHVNGFVLNVRREPSPDYVVLHRALCRSIGRTDYADGAYTGRGYRKVCADTLDALRDAAKREGRRDGSFSKRCGLCQP